MPVLNPESPSSPVGDCSTGPAAVAPNRAWIARFTPDAPKIQTLCNEYPDSWELVATNPALALCVAHAASWDSLLYTETEDPESPARSRSGITKELLGLKRRVLCQRLGFPGTESTVKLLAKIPPEACSLPLLMRLRRSLQDPSLFKALSHLAVIDHGTLTTAVYWRWGALVSGEFLKELGEYNTEENRGFFHRIYGILDDTVRMLQRLDRPMRPIRGGDQMIRLHNRLADELNDADFPPTRLGEIDLGNLPKVFAPPPIEGIDGIEPITTPKALIEEGRQQRHCVAIYVPQVFDGEYYIYRVTDPERATLALVKYHDSWTIDQIYAAKNKPVSPVTLVKVARWVDPNVSKKQLQDLCSTFASDATPSGCLSPEEQVRQAAIAEELLRGQTYLGGSEREVLERARRRESYNVNRFRAIAIAHGYWIDPFLDQLMGAQEKSEGIPARV